MLFGESLSGSDGAYQDLIGLPPAIVAYPSRRLKHLWYEQSVKTETGMSGKQVLGSRQIDRCQDKFAHLTQRRPSTTAF